MNNTAGRKFAVITGGSSGIGYEFAKVCAEEDFGVLLIADQGVDDAAEGLMSSGAAVSTLEADLTTYEGNESVGYALRGTSYKRRAAEATRPDRPATPSR